jgi:hypothetical protein
MSLYYVFFVRKTEGRKWVLFFQDTNGLLFNVCTLASLLCYNFIVKNRAFLLSLKMYREVPKLLHESGT